MPPKHPKRPLATSLSSISRRSIWYHPKDEDSKAIFTSQKKGGNSPASSYRMSPESRNPPMIELLQVSHQIYDEGTEIFFTGNRFILLASSCISYPCAFSCFLRDQSSRSSRLIRHIGLTSNQSK